MSHKIKGILSFPVLTETALENKRKRDANAKYGLTLLLPPNDPQVETINNVVNTAIADGFPNGFPSQSTKCFDLYENKIAADKDYYDPQFKGWYIFSCSTPEKPTVVDENLQPIMNPADLYAGAVVWVNCGISKFPKGKQGIGGWLNGVMLTKEESPVGRLDNKPTVEQMFGGVASPSAAATPAPAPTPVPPQPPVPPAAAATAYTMTPKANGASIDAFLSQGWTEAQLVEQGYATLSSGVQPSFM